jgi:CHRD domain-containing protein
MNLKLKLLAAAVVVAVVATPVASTAQAVHAKLDGFQVVSSQSTPGTGTFRAKVDRANKTIEYTVSWKDLLGDIIQSHIHFNRPGFNGGIVTFLCTNVSPSNDPSRSSPVACSGKREGSASGVMKPENVIYLPFGNQFPAPPGGTQGITPNSDAGFEQVADAIEAGAAYIVVHTCGPTTATTPCNPADHNAGQPSGELRGQVSGRREADPDADER